MGIVKVDFDMEMHIDKEAYYILEETITVCVITDKYGFKHKGESFCANKELFSKELGEKYSREAAIEAMIPYYSFLAKYIEKTNK